MKAEEHENLMYKIFGFKIIEEIAMKNRILIYGSQCTGKTTLAKIINKYNEYKVIDGCIITKEIIVKNHGKVIFITNNIEDYSNFTYLSDFSIIKLESKL